MLWKPLRTLFQRSKMDHHIGTVRCTVPFLVIGSALLQEIRISRDSFRRTISHIAFCQRKSYTSIAVYAMKTGSRAIFHCEPCQGRKAAAISSWPMCCGGAPSERDGIFMGISSNRELTECTRTVYKAKKTFFSSVAFVHLTML